MVQVGRWTIAEYEVLPSTNLIAAPLPAWHAVRADRQTAGRGRFQRPWVSDAGGLWLSAVLPMPGDPVAVRILPLVAGLAVCSAIRSVGVEDLRMRWPNDVLVNEAKLAGILIDQFVPERCVVGIGLNIANRPEACDRLLAGQVVRLADLVHPVPPLAEVLQRVLLYLEEIWRQLESAGPGMLLPAINALWPATTEVRLDLDEGSVTGVFLDVDAAGRLRLRAANGELRFYEPHEVRLFREKIHL